MQGWLGRGEGHPEVAKGPWHELGRGGQKYGGRRGVFELGSYAQRHVQKLLRGERAPTLGAVAGDVRALLSSSEGGWPEEPRPAADTNCGASTHRHVVKFIVRNGLFHQVRLLCGP